MNLSSQQQRVLEELKRARCPLGAYALLNRLRNEGFKTPVQMYRILSKLVEHGLVHRLETLNAYIFRRRGSSNGFAVFAICDNCGHVDEVLDANVGSRLGSCTHGQKFRLESTAVEVRGICSTCARLLPHERGRAARHA